MYNRVSPLNVLNLGDVDLGENENDQVYGAETLRHVARPGGGVDFENVVRIWP
jgi:hypothetical protein